MLYWVRLTRVLRIQHIGQYFGTLESLRINAGFLNIFKQFVQLVLTAHWLACWWYFVGIQEATPPLWDRIAESQPAQRYIESVYFVIVSMATGIRVF